MRKKENEKFSLMKIQRSLDRIKETDLSDMGLFELSIHSLMPSDVFKEIRSRLLQMEDRLKVADVKGARAIVKKLLASPQRREEKNNG